MNFTNIILLPKVPNPSSIINFSPISLCSVVYKIIAKMVAIRLRQMLDGCTDHRRVPSFRGD